MIGLGAFTVFALGLRHGADPDHLAAIDNVTRNAYVKTPLLSRFVGTFFAGGHSVMVLALSALAGLVGARFAAHGALIETIGTWVSIVVLLGIAALNIGQLRSGAEARPRGAKTRLLPRALRDGTSAFIAIPIGLLFGFGFETSSQVAAYAIAFGANSGAFGAVIVGSMFALGMIVTDTLDSLMVHRFLAFRSARVPHVMRVWLTSVTMFSIAVAGYEIAQVSGWIPTSPSTDLAVSATLVIALGSIFTYVFYQTRKTSPVFFADCATRAAVIPGEVP